MANHAWLFQWIGWSGLVLSLPFAAAQNANSSASPRLATGGLVSSILAAPVVGQPYSAGQAHGTTRTLADGSAVSHHGHHIVARDAEGRVHVEMRMAEGRNGEPDQVMVFVMDPVAHTLTTWLSNVPNQPKVASLIKLPPPGRAASPVPAETPPTEDHRPQPIITTEDLGTKTIQGLETMGKRTTTIVPIGRSGNSAPITKTYEVWTSADMGLVIKQVWNDPRSAERTIELKDLSRVAPDPSLFRPPAGYEVKGARETLKELEQKLDANTE
jgi:nitrogen fixation protein FixH